MTLHTHHAAELIDGSGIDPAIVAARGYRSVTADEAAALGFAPSQCRPGLFLPTYTLAGAAVDGMLKPDEPRLDEKGKPLKYEWPAGRPPLLDAHPDALAALKERGRAKWFTEGHKKADAAWSRGLACVNLPGVYMFLHKRLVVPDLDELELDGETCFVVFDSDVTRKPSVADALLRFCAVLHRRGARVQVVSLPEPADGGKTGLDDWFAAGGTVAELEALAVPWSGQGPGVWLRGADEAELARRLATAEADNRALVNAINVLSLTELRAAVSTGALVASKLSRGDVNDDGDVIISAAEVSNDYRPKPEPKGKLAPTNPDGTRPRMPRGNVKPLLEQAVKAGAIRARPIPVDRKHASGAAWRDTAWIVSPIASLAEALNPWVAARTQTPKERKPRTVAPPPLPAPCPHCREVHPITQIDYCGGCGAVLDRPTIPETGDNLSPVKTPPSPDPSPIGRQTISGLPARAHDHLADASRTDAPEPREALYADLANVTRERGRTPVPKPLPNLPAERQPDPWAEYAP